MKAINNYCPRSGKPVQGNSLAEYRGHIVGFCNPGCSTDFANNIEKNLNDTRYFDVLIKEKFNE